jgi:hypothetical protein
LKALETPHNAIADGMVIFTETKLSEALAGLVTAVLEPR